VVGGCQLLGIEGSQNMGFDPIQWRYSQTGKIAKDKTPLIFLHGFLGSRLDFLEVVSQFKDERLCLSLDLPGHGKDPVSLIEESYQLDHIAHSLVNFLESLNLCPCHLVGYSLGGRIALYLLLHFPDYFSSGILISTSPGLKTIEEQQDRIQKDRLLSQQLETESLDLFLERWYSQPLFHSIKSHPAFEAMLERRIQGNPFELAKALRQLSLGQQPSLWDLLKENRIPLCLVVGGEDEKFCRLNQEMSQVCQDTQLVLFKGCGHTLHLENPSLLAQTIQTFIEKL
jgi:2-succinyl-6-hydroxy-2,4-cyclohexadiene-1-carboxylate synthase